MSHCPEFITTGDLVTSSQQPGFAIFLDRSTRNSFHHPLAAMEPEVSSRQEEPVAAQDTRDSMGEPSQGNAGSAIPESAGGCWNPCHLSEEILSSMEQEGLIAENEISKWRVEPNIDMPLEKEVVMLKSHINHGLSLRPSYFLKSMLFHYKLQLHHIAPNSFTIIAGFVAL
jgi:hypothetical protein